MFHWKLKKIFSAVLFASLMCLMTIYFPFAKTKQVQKKSLSLEKAIFGGGCYWRMQPPFDELPGVLSTEVGYTGGTTSNPTYEEVAKGMSGHVEGIQITYNPSKISYSQLIDVFWRNIDPMDTDGQFSNRGKQYRAIIFYQNEKEKKIALDSKQNLEKSGKFSKPIVTEILPASTFYKADEHQQNYYKKHPWKYIFFYYYHGGFQRNKLLNKVWGKVKWR